VLSQNCGKRLSASSCLSARNNSVPNERTFIEFVVRVFLICRENSNINVMRQNEYFTWKQKWVLYMKTKMVTLHENKIVYFAWKQKWLFYMKKMGTLNEKKNEYSIWKQKFVLYTKTKMGTLHENKNEYSIWKQKWVHYMKIKVDTLHENKHSCFTWKYKWILYTKTKTSILHENKNGTLYENKSIFLITSRAVLLRMRNVSDKSYREN
jgi:hypothetical protein